MPNTITISWDVERDQETEVSYSHEWEQMLPMAKLDNLKDAYMALLEKYTDVGKELWGEGFSLAADTQPTE